MTTRMLKIPGRDAAARRARMKTVSAWMTAHGWRVADFAEEAGSALFERPADAPPLGLLHPTRWLPGPRALHPRQWWTTLRADLRVAVLPGVLLALGLWFGLVLFSPSALDVDAVRQAAEEANWYVVTVSQLNVREGPGADHQVVGVLYRDQRVLVEGKVAGGWVRIGVPERGYVAGQYLAQPTAGEAAGDTAEENAGAGEAR